MEWNYVDSLVDSQTILSLRDIEENGLGQHQHRCPKCQSSFLCEKEMCVSFSVTRCRKPTCIDQGLDQ